MNKCSLVSFDIAWLKEKWCFRKIGCGNHLKHLTIVYTLKYKPSNNKTSLRWKIENFFIT